MGEEKEDEQEPAAAGHEDEEDEQEEDDNAKLPKESATAEQEEAEISPQSPEPIPAEKSDHKSNIEHDLEEANISGAQSSSGIPDPEKTTTARIPEVANDEQNKEIASNSSEQYEEEFPLAQTTGRGK